MSISPVSPRAARRPGLVDGLLERGHQVHQLARPGRRLGSLRGWNTMGTILGVGDFSGDVKADLATVTNDSYDGAECGLPPHTASALYDAIKAPVNADVFNGTQADLDRLANR